MPYAPKRLGQFLAGVAPTTFYTVPADALTIVKNVVVANTTPGPVGLTLSAVPAGGLVGPGNRLVPGTLVGGYSVVTFDLSTVLAAGDFLVASATVADALTVTVSGVEEPGSNGLSSGSVVGPAPAFGAPAALGTANAEGASPLIARADHVHGGLTLAAPLDGADAAALGAELAAARGDHRHRTVTSAAPLDGAVAAALGASDLAARGDHRHRTVGSTTPAAVTGAAAVGAAELAARADHAHAYGSDLTLPWLSIPFVNGWGSYDAVGGTWADPGYYVDRFGWVHCKGLISGGTVTNESIMWTFPVGARPPAGQGYHQPVVTNAAFSFVRVRADGTVTCGTGISAAWVDISMVRFRTV